MGSILTPRYTSDSIALWKSAIELEWDVERLQNWKVPTHLQQCLSENYLVIA
jgi:hypothetical protein